jgi:hypothetical protein
MAMTEGDWLACARVTQPVIKWLRRHASQRKFYLIAVAAVRQAQSFLRDPRSRDALEIAERFADGLATERQLQVAHDAALAGAGEVGAHPNGGRLTPEEWRVHECAMAAVFASMPPSRFPPANRAPTGAWLIAYNALHYAAKTGTQKEMGQAQATVLRDVIGNPFRPVTIDPSWLGWNGGAIQHLAQAIYDDRSFDRMPILADALEDAGCENSEVLDHCRGPGPHVRGCWVVDLLLAKE